MPLLFITLGTILANNISIQKVAITDTNRTAKTANIRFSISWEHSWRDSINWDAAWIFIKFREPKDSIWHYRHLTLSANGSNNPGTGTASMKFAFSADNKGVFYYRQGIGDGTIKMDSVKLSWNYGADNVSVIDSVEVKVFATEMVFVPTGNYCLGDGNGTSTSPAAFQMKSAPNNFAVITNNWSPVINTVNGTVYGDDATISNGIRISGLSGIDITGDTIAEYPNFPTGYRSFYCMKYPVSQGQYADFLNTLSIRDTSDFLYSNNAVSYKSLNKKYRTALQTLDPFFVSIPTDLQRYTIVFDSLNEKYNVSRPDRALGIVYTNSTAYYLSFSDWSALRPISEMEFEKACRGPLPPVYKTGIGYYNSQISDTSSNWFGFDWPWGNDTSIAKNTFSDSYSILQYSGIENGTEYFTNYNIYKRYINPIYSNFNSGNTITFSGGDGGNGPYRVGIFANDSSTRISSGATYYGIMDFGKNVTQYAVTAGNQYSRTFSYINHGDGFLNYLGYPDNNEFFTGNSASVSNLYIPKQGAVSDRSVNYIGYHGFRCVRTAPSDN